MSAQLFAHRAFLMAQAKAFPGDPVDGKKHAAHEEVSQDDVLRRYFAAHSGYNPDQWEEESEEEANDFELEDDSVYESEMSAYQAVLLPPDEPFEEGQDGAAPPQEDTVSPEVAPPASEPQGGA